MEGSGSLIPWSVSIPLLSSNHKPRTFHHQFVVDPSPIESALNSWYKLIKLTDYLTRIKQHSYHLLAQAPCAIRCSKCLADVNPLVPGIAAPEAARASNPTWDIRNRDPAFLFLEIDSLAENVSSFLFMSLHCIAVILSPLLLSPIPLCQFHEPL